MPLVLSKFRAVRAGRTNPLVIGLLAGIFLALIALIVIIARQPPGENNALVVHASDGTTTTKVTTPPPSQERIRETAKAGKTYHIVLKAGFDARVEDKDWGVKTVTSLAFASEFVVDRTIEINDGQKIVELRRFPKARCVKLLCNVDDVRLELGPSGVLILGALDALVPGTAEAAVVATPILEKILQVGGQELARAEATKAFAQIDSIQGKQVRITFVPGKGVTSLEPVGCTLTKSEESYLLTTAVLSDYYIMPDLKIAIGGTWSIPGNQFGTLFDPSWKGVPSGTIVVRRDSDSANDGKPIATLRVESGVIELDATDQANRRVGSFTPRGLLEYRLDEQFARSAQLVGQLRFEEVSKDHLLFESRFHTQPKLQVDYSCEMR